MEGAIHVKKHVKGFTMIELIIVIAIIGIFTALSTISLNYIHAGNIKSSAQKVNRALTELKMDTMSRDKKSYMYLYKKDSNYYMWCTTNNTFSADSAAGERIGNSSTTITFNGSELKDGECKQISYLKSSGAFAKGTPSNITFSKDNGDFKYVVTLVVNTGKHYIDKV